MNAGDRGQYLNHPRQQPKLLKPKRRAAHKLHRLGISLRYELLDPTVEVCSTDEIEQGKTPGHDLYDYCGYAKKHAACGSKVT